MPKRSPKRYKSPKRRTPTRKSPKRRSSTRKSPKRKSPKRKSPKRRTPTRKSPKRRSTSRQTREKRNARARALRLERNRQAWEREDEYLRNKPVKPPPFRDKLTLSQYAAPLPRSRYNYSSWTGD
jgi:hypothetical protein